MLINQKQQLKVETRFAATVDGLRETAKSLNRLVLNFNLKAPRGVTHKPMFDFEREFQQVK